MGSRWAGGPGDRFAAGRRVRAQVRDNQVGEAHIAEEDVLLHGFALTARRLLPRLLKALFGEPGEYVRLGRRPRVERGGFRARGLDLDLIDDPNPAASRLGHAQVEALRVDLKEVDPAARREPGDDLFEA